MSSDIRWEKNDCTGTDGTGGDAEPGQDRGVDENKGKAKGRAAS